MPLLLRSLQCSQEKGLLLTMTRVHSSPSRSQSPATQTSFQFLQRAGQTSTSGHHPSGPCCLEISAPLPLLTLFSSVILRLWSLASSISLSWELVRNSVFSFTVYMCIKSSRDTLHIYTINYMCQLFLSKVGGKKKYSFTGPSRIRSSGGGHHLYLNRSCRGCWHLLKLKEHWSN